LDQLTQLLLDKKDGRLVRMDTTNEYTREVVSARTDAILRHLDKENQQSIVEFLHGLGLLNRKENPVVSLAGLNFTGINWDRADLERADLREVDCSFASLVEANLQEADLEGADLTGATLTEAHLMDADLSGADLSGADLSGADLSGANLGGADLRDADLSNATVTQEQLDQIKYLQGATMPNGQKYEDWLKSKARGEEGANRGTS
jgi:uncharacterized protein YjbI with pentapeptide repeats